MFKMFNLFADIVFNTTFYKGTLMTITLTHKYKWKTDMKIAAPIFILLPVLLWFTTNPTFTYVVGGMSLFIGLLITTVNIRRLNRSKLTVTATDDGVLTITGSGLKETNTGVLRNIDAVGSDKKAYHPTLVFYFENMKQLVVPRRIAEMPQINTWMKKNFPKTVNKFKDEKAILLFEDLFVPEDKRKFTEFYNEEQARKEKEEGYVEPVVVDLKKQPKPTKASKAFRKAEARREKEEKQARLAESMAALEKEEKKLGL